MKHLFTIFTLLLVAFIAVCFITAAVSADTKTVGDWAYPEPGYPEPTDPVRIWQPFLPAPVKPTVAPTPTPEPIKPPFTPIIRQAIPQPLTLFEYVNIMWR